MSCNRRSPGSGCPAVAGDHENLTIFGYTADAGDGAACVATHPSDMSTVFSRPFRSGIWSRLGGGV